ncbi:hypothetical protein ABU186_00935 [Weissella paramesenteroides]
MSEEQQQRQKQKQALSIKSMAFNRFLLFRYVTAVFSLPIYIGQFYYWGRQVGIGYYQQYYS